MLCQQRRRSAPANAQTEHCFRHARRRPRAGAAGLRIGERAHHGAQAGGERGRERRRLALQQLGAAQQRHILQHLQQRPRLAARRQQAAQRRQQALRPRAGVGAPAPRRLGLMWPWDARAAR